MIRRGALVSVSTSGGKDSQAMTILLARIVPRDQLVAVHAPLGEVEWPGTIDHILAQACRSPGAVASWQDSCSIASKTRMWSNSIRWCTSPISRPAPSGRELRRYLKAHPRFGGRVVNAMGMRADESRRTGPEGSLAAKRPHERCRSRGLRLAAGPRSLDRRCVPVIQNAGQSPHWAYAAHVEAVPCAFAPPSRADAAGGRELYRLFRIGHRCRSRVPLPQLTGIPL